MTYQHEVAARVETEYQIELRHPDRIETPDRNGRVYCEALYLATAPWDYKTGRRSTKVAEFVFDNTKYAA